MWRCWWPAPIGASAVLLFAVPSSPLAQPWPIVGGNSISALVGVTVALFVHDPVIASGVAVALAIAAMLFTRSLHPPGGAAALTAVLGGPAVLSFGFLFLLVPVALNSTILVALGLLFHRLSWRNYPHVHVPAASTHGTADPPATKRVGFRPEDVDTALAVWTKHSTSAATTSKGCCARSSCRPWCARTKRCFAGTSCPVT